MKNRLDDHVGELCTTKTTGGLLCVENQCTTPPYHDEPIVITPAVKEYRESLLIILPEATSRPAEQGNNILPADNRIFPVPYRSSKMVLHVRYSKSYQVSAS